MFIDFSNIPFFPSKPLQKSKVKGIKIQQQAQKKNSTQPHLIFHALLDHPDIPVKL